MKKSYTISIPIFPLTIDLFINYTEEDTRKLYKYRLKNSAKELDSFVKGIMDNLGTTVSMEGLQHFHVLLPNIKNLDSETISIIAHESNHVVIRFLTSLDIKLTGHTEEIYCYLLDYVVKKITDKVNSYISLYLEN